jgi:hypothetical protein
MALVGEQDALAEQVWLGSSVQLEFGHIGAVEVAFDGAGAVGHGEPGGDGGPVFAESLGESAQLADRAGLGLGGPGGRSTLKWIWVDTASPGWQVFAVLVAEHVGEVADQGLGLRVLRSEQ